MRVFLDANVLFSAGRPNSPLRRLVEAAIRKATVVTSDAALAEARKNLALKRPEWQVPFEALLPGLEIVTTAVFALPVPLAQKDVPIFCAAIRGSCDTFVTGDRRDFGHLFDRTVHDVTIITPLRLAKLLAAPDSHEA